MLSKKYFCFALTLEINIPGSSMPKGWLAWSEPPTMLKPKGLFPFFKTTSYKTKKKWIAVLKVLSLCYGAVRHLTWWFQRNNCHGKRARKFLKALLLHLGSSSKSYVRNFSKRCIRFSLSFSFFSIIVDPIQLKQQNLDVVVSVVTVRKDCA